MDNVEGDSLDGDGPWTIESVVMFSDLAIFLAYMAIPVQIMVIFQAETIPDTVRQVRVAFFCFILSCGVTHFLSTLPKANWSLIIVAFSKALCAVVSVMTVVILHRYFQQLRNLLVQGAVLEKEVQENRVKLAAMRQKHMELKRSQSAALRLAKTKSDFVATMSHEIRTPLHAIIGLADLLGMDELTPLQKSNVGIIHRSGQVLLSILNDILDSSRLDAVEFSLAEESFDLAHCLETVEKIVEVESNQKNIELRFIFNSSDFKTPLVGDERRLTQVLTNLLCNAVKFTKQGSVSLSVHVRDPSWVRSQLAREGVISSRNAIDPATEERQLAILASANGAFDDSDLESGRCGDDRSTGTSSETSTLHSNGSRGLVTRTDPSVVFEITDTGVGISSIHLPRIFGRFVQADSSISRTFGGSGLGLSISKKLVEKMGGEILVCSSENEGSTFWVCIPLPCFSQGPGEHPNLQLCPAIGDDSSKEGNEEENSRFCNPKEEASEQPKDPVDAESLPILVAEDNATNRLVVDRMMRKMGFKAVSFVTNGKEAVEFCKTNDVSLVLMDIHMPVMDGIEATAQIRAMRGHSVKIIALTAGLLENYRELQFDRHILKPCTKAAIMAAICDDEPEEPLISLS